ncbi:hypothetical protein [Streptomyces sp. NPDC048584]|uniref:hypothetical protein n=1 Tax=Streptomyces sp. NPDC048584 TaxID=3365573 RepID=UPI00370F9E24
MAVAEQLVITGRHTEAGLAAAIVRGFPVLLTVESAVQGRGTIESFEGAVAESDEAVHCLRSFGRPDHHGSRDRRPALRPEAA